ncbi:hypothetical protein P8605_02380 [Streptomyces sp. T-3]|nr:hypothetical protein [Streptomyces sp. T-3]
MFTLGFVLAAALAAPAFIKANSVRALRHRLNPSAPELAERALLVGRITFLVMAGITLILTLRSIDAADDFEWSDDELASAVRQGTAQLDGSSFVGLPGNGDGEAGATGPGSASDTTTIEDTVGAHGGGEAPTYGVTAEPVEPHNVASARYTITASGTDAAFCISVRQTRSKKDDDERASMVPGQSSVTLPGYRLAATSHNGAC